CDAARGRTPGRVSCASASCRSSWRTNHEGRRGRRGYRARASARAARVRARRGRRPATHLGDRGPRGRDARVGTARGAHAPARATGGRRAPTFYPLLGERALDERIERLVTRSGDPAEVIQEELAEHDGIVFGATGREGARDPLGPVGHAILGAARAAIIVRTSLPVAALPLAPSAALPVGRPERSKAIGELVDAWFTRNTFSSSEVADLARLVDAKAREGLRVSVALPTLNEEATI